MNSTEIVYYCSDCIVLIEGETWDIQEAARLYCPSCNEEMELEESVGDDEPLEPHIQNPPRYFGVEAEAGMGDDNE
jgi:DNA-directed RNA polymerase subunit RPC12/RpoP